MLLEQQFPVDQEVVEVHGVRFPFAVFVAPEDVDHLLLVDCKMGIVVLQMQLQRRPRVDQIGVDVQEDVAFREAFFERLDAEGGDGAVHHFLGVFVVEDREIRPITDRLGVAAKQAIADRVKGAAPDAARVDGHQLLDAAEHLAGGLVGESQQEDVLRIDAVLNEARHAVGEGARLSAAGTRDHQQWSLAGHDHLQLLGIQVLVVADAIGLLSLDRLLEGVTADFGGHCRVDRLLGCENAFVFSYLFPRTSNLEPKQPIQQPT